MKFLKIIDDQIVSFIKLKGCPINNINWQTIVSEDIKRGHFSSNCVFIIAGLLKISPLTVGEELKNYLNETNVFQRVEFIKPGFINVFLKNEDIDSLLSTTISKDSKNKKMYLEYISANPTGVLHLGHLRIGLVTKIYNNLCNFFNETTYAEFLVNDGGVQINTLINSILEIIQETKPFEEITYASQELSELAEQIKKDKTLFKEITKNPNSKTIKKYVVDFFLKLINKDMKSFGVKTKKLTYIHEEEFASKTKTEELIQKMKKMDIAYEKEGALFLRTTNKGDDFDRVLVKSNKERTYVFTDILYHIHKFDTKPGYTYLNVWGADQQNNEIKLRYAFDLLKDKRHESLKILYSQMVHLKKNGEIMKMSKRNKTLILVKDVEEFAPIENLSHYMMSKSISTTLAIDIEQLKKNDKSNTLYYLQYSYARICQLLKKAEEKGFNLKLTKKANYEFNNQEVGLILLCNKTSSILNSVLFSMEIHKIYTFLYDICEAFHSYYQSTKILSDQLDKDIIRKKLELVLFVKKNIETLFTILDINAKTYMSQN